MINNPTQKAKKIKLIYKQIYKLNIIKRIYRKKMNRFNKKINNKEIKSRSKEKLKIMYKNKRKK